VGWYVDNEMVETICPYDYASNWSGNPTEGASHEPVHGIPERTIGALLLKLADQHGNNIVGVI
jgi:hypothetical protein